MTVLGTGYLGATHAACMAEIGHEVLGVDGNPEKVLSLAAGKVPFYEPGLAALIARHVASGRLSFTQSLPEAAEFGDAHFLCVGTPSREGSDEADLRYLHSVIDGIAPHLRRPTLVVGKSTVPVGTAAQLAGRLHEIAPASVEVELVWNPEFLREGHAVEDTLNPDRIVVGAQSEAAELSLRSVYAPLIEKGIPFLTTDFSTAELVKVAANAFLSTKISFINAMAEVCEATGADVWQLAAALSYDSRIGARFLSPGLGFGGGCLPKDLRAFVSRGKELGVDRALEFLRSVDEINTRSRLRMVSLARQQCGGSFSGKRVTVWGAAFKPDSDDVRDSPALFVAESIQSEGGKVVVYDPKANDNARKEHPNLQYAQDAIEAAENAHVLLHATEWKEFREIDPNVVGEIVDVRRVIDGRGTLDPESWRAAGWEYFAPGKPTSTGIRPCAVGVTNQEGHTEPPKGM
ncbi:UDP-glucose/GDP-mannose dehydrogenase family protein [Streptomyces sp. NBS 14/10]|uniref:UDP-glucose dehydrogenase family protein n=1 Tax=Streptomyces sp. NBS 14/10 TaxID=1945643 RepID=UPI000B7ED09D